MRFKYENVVTNAESETDAVSKRMGMASRHTRNAAPATSGFVRDQRPAVMAVESVNVEMTGK